MVLEGICIPTPRKVTGNSKGEGVSRLICCIGKYKPELKFPEGWVGTGGQNFVIWTVSMEILKHLEPLIFFLKAGKFNKQTWPG